MGPNSVKQRNTPILNQQFFIIKIKKKQFQNKAYVSEYEEITT